MCRLNVRGDARSDYCFAGGYRAKVTFGGGTPLGHHGTFVWAVANALALHSVSANEFAVRHIGPTSQDFGAAFDVGVDERHIATVDADGVALAAIQGLNAKFDAVIAERDARIVKQDREIAELRHAVEVLLTRASPDGRLARGR